MELAQKQGCRSVEQNRKPRNNPINWLWQSRQEYIMGKKVFSISGAGKTGQLQIKDGEGGGRGDRDGKHM